MKNLALAIALLVLGNTCVAQDSTFVPFGSIWKYLDNGTNQSAAWRMVSYVDTAWASGPAELGYGDGDEATVVSYGPNANNKYITTYFRHNFNIPDTSIYKNFLLRLKKDDGAIVYINGQEAMRSNFGTSSYSWSAEAYSSISGSEETIIWEEMAPTSYFRNGSNLIAVEVHQVSPTSSDLTFDMELIGFDADPGLYREPYVQKSTPDAVTIKWKTDVPTTSRVRFGTAVGSQTNTVDSSGLTVNHEVTLSGLSPDTRYYYTVGNAATDFAGGTADYFAQTNPPVGASRPTRIWVTGDAGTGKSGQLDVRDSYLNYIGANGKADLWLMMGDNAYEHGRQADYHMGLFNVYPTILRNTVSFPTSGNHDFYGEASPISETGTYYDIFALPKQGECGGVPSGTESYFSYDYGKVHFICLESYGLDRDSMGTMATWLKADLQATTADWVIAYWHYAPYTKVGHDSDDPNDHSGRAIEMRENINPILEAYGVDLVLSGHSHGYERSYLLDGHYGYSNSLVPSMILDSSSGKADVTGAYPKPTGLFPHYGTVYLVCGSSGKLSSPPSQPHPAMFTTNANFLGSVIIDIDGDTLESKFLNENGLIQDYFHIVKGAISVSSETPSSTLSFGIGPNPTGALFKIVLDLPEAMGQGRAEIYSTNGSLMRRTELGELRKGKNSVGMDASGLSAGIYTVRVFGGDIHLGSKLLVVR